MWEPSEVKDKSWGCYICYIHCCCYIHYLLYAGCCGLRYSTLYKWPELPRHQKLTHFWRVWLLSQLVTSSINQDTMAFIWSFIHNNIWFTDIFIFKVSFLRKWVRYFLVPAITFKASFHKAINLKISDLEKWILSLYWDSQFKLIENLFLNLNLITFWAGTNSSFGFFTHYSTFYNAVCLPSHT